MAITLLNDFRRFALVGLVISSLLPMTTAGGAEESPGISEPDLSDSDRNHWSFRPLRPSLVPAVQTETWPQNEIDCFVLSKLEAKGMRPLPPADKLAWLRRVTFDLTGLPPTLEEQRTFRKDTDPIARERVIDRLLASPHYGIRWAQHWLDLARFAETDGFEHDLVRPNAWRFRDWVVTALNEDVPYDEFVRLQIAGDLLKPGDPQAAIATGWLLCGPDMPDINLQEERRHVILNEMASTAGSVFLGLQIGCAQCHDHKYDPLSQADFYRLRACFESAQMFQDHPIPSPVELRDLELARQKRGTASQVIEQQITKWDDVARQRIREKNPDLQPAAKDILEALTPEERKEYRDLTRERDQLPKLPELSKGRVLREGPAKECRFCIRGDFRRPGPAMPPGVPRVLSSVPGGWPEASAASSAHKPEGTHESFLFTTDEPARAQLARWLTRPDNALAARVIVNRIWQYHFGEGLVRTSSDFGKMGDDPEHLELLDWLAIEFPRHNWSLKWLHKQVLLSATYQQASRADSTEWTDEIKTQARQTWNVNLAQDPANRYWGRMSRQRLEGEAIRDALLTLSDRLNPSVAGPGIRPPLPPEMVATLLKNQWPVTPDLTEHHRRSLYLFVRRNLRYPLFEAFDRPDTNASCPRRNRSTIAPQALILLNSDLTLTAARNLCGCVLREAPQDLVTQVELCYQRALGRMPTLEESEEARQFLQSETEHLSQSPQASSNLPLPSTPLPNGVVPAAAAAMTELCLAILNVNEFVYLD